MLICSPQAAFVHRRKVVERHQIIAEGLPFVAEAHRGKLEKRSWIGDVRQAAPGQANDRAFHFRRRTECIARNWKQNLGIRVNLRLDRQIAKVASSRFCRQSVRHLGLHQENGAGPVFQRKHLFKNRRSDVVGQVADDDGAGKIGLQNVAFDDLELACIDCVAEFLIYVMDEMRIDFNRHDLIGTGQQRFRESALAGADFDNPFHAVAASRFGDAIQDRFSKKEVLAEAATQASKPSRSFR